jgi:excisionase family DNA binding protein
MGEPWSSVEQVAAHLGSCRIPYTGWIEARGLPAHKVRRLRKFKLSEVDDWIHAEGAESCEKPTAKIKTVKRGRS